jgi:hypothetical protein
MKQEDWVAIAHYSEGFGRSNLQQSWREKDYLVATDGHRIHLARGYPVIEGTRYVDERNETPPNVQTIFDITDKAPVVAELTIEKGTFKTLKTLASIKEEVRCTIKTTQGTANNKASVTLHGRSLVSKLQFELPLIAEQVFRDAEITVNLEYLFDAVAWIHPTYLNGTIELSWDPQRAGAMLKVHALTKQYTAVIAPMHKE